MLAPSLVKTAASWTRADLAEALKAARSPATVRLLRRAWLLHRPWWWLVETQPKVYRHGFPDGPKLELARAFASTPPSADYRTPAAILVEMGRGLGKTKIARGMALHRLIEGLEAGLAFAGSRLDDATDATKEILALGIPPLRGNERPSDPTVQAWLSSEMGALYPSLRIEGSVTSLILHFEGRRLPIWTIAPGASTRGRVLGDVRPSLVIADDLVTLEAATSEQQAARIVEWVADDARGLGGTYSPASVWWLGNAIAAGDSLDLAARSARWHVVRGTVWSPHAPPASPEKRQLLAELLAVPPQDPIPLDLRERWGPVLSMILAGAAPTDPDIEPMALLRQEALTGERAFARAYMCERLASGEALWPMDRATLVDLDRGHVIEPEGRTSLAGARGAVWLDPRGSQEGERGDFAGAAAVVRMSSGRRIVVYVAGERCRKAEQRAIYWRGVDALLALGVSNITGGYETNNGAGLAFDDDWRTDAQERRARGLPAPVPTGTASRSGKYGAERLDRVTDHIADGRLRFARSLYMSPSWIRMSRMPHDHDDDGDAVERADHLLGEHDLSGWLASMR